MKPLVPNFLQENLRITTSVGVLLKSQVLADQSFKFLKGNMKVDLKCFIKLTWKIVQSFKETYTNQYPVHTARCDL